MKTTKSDLKRIIREELENVLTEGQFYGDDEMMDDDRREELISMIYDIMKDNRSGNQEEDFAAAKDELESDGEATTDELDEIQLDDVLQMGGSLVSEQKIMKITKDQLKQITFKRWQDLSGVK